MWGVLLLLLLLRDAAAAEEEKEEGEEGKQEQQQFIIRARLGFRPSVCVCVCVCVFSLSLKEECAVFLLFFWNFDKKKQDNPHRLRPHYYCIIYSHEAINQSINQFDSFYTHTHTLSTKATDNHVCLCDNDDDAGCIDLLLLVVFQNSSPKSSSSAKYFFFFFQGGDS